MYATSTQKRYWIYTPEELQARRSAVNQAYVDRHKPFLESEEQLEMFPTAEEERLFSKIVAETGIRFGKDFRPELPPSVRWTALMYYKRFYLKMTPIEFAPKSVMLTAHFLAAKVDEFNIRTDQFVRNVKNGEPQKNAELILKMEPKLMENLEYQLTIHTPFRAFEGHLIEMKTRLPLIDFDLEQVRGPAMQFFDLALAGDAMLIYPPTQIAMAGLKYGLDKMGKSTDLIKDFLYNFLELDQWSSKEEEKIQVNKLLNKVDEIIQLVQDQAVLTNPEVARSFQEKIRKFSSFLSDVVEVKMNSGADAMSADNGAMSDDSD